MTGPRVTLAVTDGTTATTFYRGYLRFLKDRGWNVTVAANQNGELAKFASQEGATAIVIPMRRNPSILRDLGSLIKWVSFLATSKPEIVVSATPKASLLSMVAARITRRPVRIYQCWGLRLETETGWRRKLLVALERLTIECATQVVCNSHSLAATLKAEGLMGSKEPIVLGHGSSHGVDLMHFRQAASVGDLPPSTAAFLKGTPNRLVVGFIGRIHADKGIHDLLDALERLERIGVEVCCVLVGSTEDEHLVEKIRLSTGYLKIHYAGHASDPRPFINAFDVLCLPSKREGFPNVVLEAAAMGVPAIVADSTGTRDSVVSGETGVVFSTGDVDALAEALREASENRETWSEFGRNARSRVEGHFAKEDLWGLQERLLQEGLSTVD